MDERVLVTVLTAHNQFGVITNLSLDGIEEEITKKFDTWIMIDALTPMGDKAQFRLLRAVCIGYFVGPVPKEQPKPQQSQLMVPRGGIVKP